MFQEGLEEFRKEFCWVGKWSIPSAKWKMWFREIRYFIHGNKHVQDTNNGRHSVEILCKIPFDCFSFLHEEPTLSPKISKNIQKKIKPKYMPLQIFIQKIKQSQTQYKSMQRMFHLRTCSQRTELTEVFKQRCSAF